jgi:hypothetical protein
MRAVWERPGYKESYATKIKEYANRPEVKERVSRQQKEINNRPEVKERTAKLAKERWKDPEHRAIIASRVKTAEPKAGRSKGVSFNKMWKKWVFQMFWKGKRYHGAASTEEAAARAYDDLARTHQGHGCYLNFPTDQEREDWLELKASLESKRKSK